MIWTRELLINNTTKRLKKEVCSLHLIDRYPAKLIPELSELLVEKYTNAGQEVLDPFCGSGSILLEAMRKGRLATGLDINPLAIIYSNAKIAKYSIELLFRQKELIMHKVRYFKKDINCEFPNMDYWFTKKTLEKLLKISAVIAEYTRSLPIKYRYFWKALLASIVRECSKADRQSLKPFISKRAIRQKWGKHTDAFAIFEMKAEKWIGQFNNNYSINTERTGAASAFVYDFRKLRNNKMKAMYYDAIITSPPYLTAQDYFRSSKLELYVLGYSRTNGLSAMLNKSMGSEQGVEPNVEEEKQITPTALKIFEKLKRKDKRNARVYLKYYRDLCEFVIISKSKLNDNGVLCVIIGNNRISNTDIANSKVLIEIATKEGFLLIEHSINRIFNRWTPKKRNGHNSVIKDEHIVVFKKTPNKKVARISSV